MNTILTMDYNKPYYYNISFDPLTNSAFISGVYCFPPFIGFDKLTRSELYLIVFLSPPPLSCSVMLKLNV